MQRRGNRRGGVNSPVPRFVLNRKANTHKGDYGRVLVVGGSIGMSGAPLLCALSALRTGAGLVTLAVPRLIYPMVSRRVAELMVHPLPDGGLGSVTLAALTSIRALLKRADVLALGPGLSRRPQTLSVVRRLLRETKQPIVLDADGIYALKGLKPIRRAAAQHPMVITPHPGEMAGLIGKTREFIQRHRKEVAAQVARALGMTVVLKGHRTAIASPMGKLRLNTTGNPGMATAGMGDLLTGMIAALIGQKLDPFEAAVAGVYLHGLAGDIAAGRVGQASLIASDLLGAIPDAIRQAASR